MKKEKKLVIISLGGSLIFPEEIDWKFIKKFKTTIEGQIEKGFKFVIITGGGRLARNYQEAAQKITKLTPDDRDWLGIHSTRMNGQLIRTIFREHAHPRVNRNPNDLEDFYNFKEDILVAAGWKPGWSTDYVAVLLAKYLGAKKIINLSNVDYVCDKDPKKFKDAKKLKSLDWKEFRKMVGNKWDPGLNAPFDPIASKLAQETDLEVAIMNGQKLKNLENYLAEKPFIGTTLKN